MPLCMYYHSQFLQPRHIVDKNKKQSDRMAARATFIIQTDNWPATAISWAVITTEQSAGDLSVVVANNSWKTEKSGGEDRVVNRFYW